jgi:hypothetical protein
MQAFEATSATERPARSAAKTIARLSRPDRRIESRTRPPLLARPLELAERVAIAPVKLPPLAAEDEQRLVKRSCVGDEVAFACPPLVSLTKTLAGGLVHAVEHELRA